MSLLPLALSQPAEALATATELLQGRPPPDIACYAHQAAAIVFRDRGQISAALRHLQAAIKGATATGSSSRLADILATSGATLVLAGRTREGLLQLDRAASLVRGDALARVRLRRAHVLWVLGRHAEALRDLQLAISANRRARNVLWEARSLNNRCLVHIELGQISLARADATRAEGLFRALGQELESVQALHNLGLVELVQGNLPAALTLLDVAADRYRNLDAPAPYLTIDRVHALLSAGLAVEAVDEAERALLTADLSPTTRATLLLVSASALLAAGRLEPARSRAAAAAQLFARQRRPRWAAQAGLVSAQAQFLAGRRDRWLLSRALDLATTLDEQRAEETPNAYLLAGRIALARDLVDDALSSFTAAARFRRSGPPLSRAAAWLAQALGADVRAETRRMLTACGHGLDALDEHRLFFNAELRAHATQHGRELALLALRSGIRRRNGRDILRWTERWRATALTAPPVRPPDDPALAADLAAYRAAVRRRDDARQLNGTASRRRTAARDGAEWESAIRQRRRHDHEQVPRPDRLDLDRLLQRLGSSRLVSLVNVDDELYAVVAGNGRVRCDRVGPAADAHREVEFARFALRRAAMGRPADLSAVSASLQVSLLGPVARSIGADPVIIVPSSRLHDAPWALLPCLTDVPMAVAPSAALWLRASEQPEPDDRPVVVVVGPGLSTGDQEATTVAGIHQRPTTLLGADATVGNTLAAFNGAWIGHVAAHGVFRADSPLFSSLQLADGPLTIHDLDRLRRPPHTVLLSACDSAVSVPVGSEELLGLVTGLLGMGTASVLASVVPVNDAATVPLMVNVHAALRDGSSLPEALLVARRAAKADPSTLAAAVSFTAWGG